MPQIDWLYHRKSCTTCKKAAAHRDGAGVTVAQTVDATKIRYGPAEALKLLDGIHKMVAVKGKKLIEFNLIDRRPSDDELIAVMIGPSGNLRAPTVRVGQTLVIGFSDEAYQQTLR